MKIKRTGENKYIALNDEGVKIGFCSVARRVLDRIFPDCPLCYEISLECDDECRDLLCGAAVTRARMLVPDETEPCRVFADVDAKDEKTLNVLSALGFGGEDGIRRMYRPVTDERITFRAPENCTIVRDYLDDEEEIRKCLRRYNECFGESNDRAWIKELTSKPSFVRILMVSPTELCGELMVWAEGSTGVIGIIQTSRAYRGQGVASYLLEDARKYFASLGLKRISFDVWLSSPGCLPLAKKCGFKPGEMLVYRPELV